MDVVVCVWCSGGGGGGEGVGRVTATSDGSLRWPSLALPPPIFRPLSLIFSAASSARFCSDSRFARMRSAKLVGRATWEEEDGRVTEAEEEEEVLSYTDAEGCSRCWR